MEIRAEGKGNLVEKFIGHHLFWCGRNETYKRESGVGCALKTTQVSKLEELLKPSGLPLRKGRCAILIFTYAPTMN